VAAISVFLPVLLRTCDRYPENIDVLPALGFQRALVAALQPTAVDPWPAVLHRRLRRWIEAVTVATVHCLLTNVRVAWHGPCLLGVGGPRGMLWGCASCVRRVVLCVL
jgi:hypothetical protein